MMQESQNRIRSMALIHETLYKSKDFARVDFRSFLDMLVPTLISSYAVGNERIAVSINSGEVLLPINAAIPCGLVVNELISNALKNAFPRDTKGGIAIELSHDGPATVILSVSDSGVGISETFDITRTATLGLQLVTMLTGQLAGERDNARVGVGQRAGIQHALDHAPLPGDGVGNILRVANADKLYCDNLAGKQYVG